MTPSRTSTRRRHHGDRLLTPDSPPGVTACDYACAPFDRAVIQADRTWGVDRLPELVSPETAAKWGSALAKLNAAITAEDADEAVARVNVCLRGIAAMDREARERGHRPISPTYWQAEFNGQTVAVIREPGDWRVVEAELRGVRVVTLAECLSALLGHEIEQPQPINLPKPEPRTKLERELEDCIPF
jgi:hypothetical protein